MHSNYTLRFPRTAREAFGHDCQFDDRARSHRRAALCLVVLYAFVAGVVVGWAV